MRGRLPERAPDRGARRVLAVFGRGPVAGLARADIGLYRAIRGIPLSPGQVQAVRVFSRTGEHGALWLGLGAVGYAVDRARRDRWARALRAVALAYAANLVLKNVFRRRRPLLAGLPQLVRTPTTLSFPSSHATTSFAAARAYRGLLPGGPLQGLAAAMALSRVLLGVHYPTDIAAGAALGTLVGGVAR